MVTGTSSRASDATSAAYTQRGQQQARLAAPDRSADETANAGGRRLERPNADHPADETETGLTLTPGDIRAIARAVADELHGRRTNPDRNAAPRTVEPVQQPPRIDPVTDLDDETWMRQCIDEKKRWALRGRELDETMRDAASPAARAQALAALERHETELKIIFRRQGEVDAKRSRLRIDREIAEEGWDNWLRRVTKERDEIRGEGWENWYRRVSAKRDTKPDRTSIDDSVDEKTTQSATKTRPAAKRRITGRAASKRHKTR